MNLVGGRQGRAIAKPPRPFPPSRPSEGKEVAVPDDIDLPTDDELSSGSSPLQRRLRKMSYPPAVPLFSDV